MLNILSITSGGFLGWSLGANDAANVFGTAVTTRVVKYSTAIVLTSVFVILGALANGSAGIHNLSSYAYASRVDTALAAFLVMLAAGATVTKDVPPDALAVARVRQENKEGWAERRRKIHGQEKR